MLRALALLLSLVVWQSPALAQASYYQGKSATVNGKPALANDGSNAVSPTAINNLLAGGALVPSGQILTGPDGGTWANGGINGTNIGATTPGTGAFAGLTATSSFTATGLVTTADLAIQGANTVLGNATSGSASPTALSVGSCSTSASALMWTTNTGFGCNTSVNAVTLGGATFASPGPIGGTTPAAGAFTTLSASSTVSGTGFSMYLASPPAIGGTVPAAGTFTNLFSTGYYSITGTTLPTQAAGTLGLGGVTSAPTLGANGEGDVYLDSTNGLVLQGQGSVNDVSFRNKVGTLGCMISTNSSNMSCGVLSAIGGTLSASTGQVRITGSQVSATLSANGQGVIYNISTTGGLGLQGQGSTSDVSLVNKSNGTALSVPTGTTNISVGGQIIAPSMTQSASAQTGTVCWAAAGLTYDATLGCLSSDERLKQISGPLSGSDATNELMHLKPIIYTWKSDAPRAKADPGMHLGLGAFSTGYVDERLIDRDKKHNPRGWRQDAMIALLVATVQQQQREIDVLKRGAK